MANIMDTGQITFLARGLLQTSSSLHSQAGNNTKISLLWDDFGTVH